VPEWEIYICTKCMVVCTEHSASNECRVTKGQHVWEHGGRAFLPPGTVPLYPLTEDEAKELEKGMADDG
jgi:hypothetical protein